MDPLTIIQKYYNKNSPLYKVLVTHSSLVMKKSVEIAQRLPEKNIDIQFLKEAAMLHDIGIFKTDHPGIDGCNGKEHYIKHGILGNEILIKEGLPKHARVCSHHTGVGLTRETIEKQGLPLPHKDFVPESIEEQIICFADLFFSKASFKLTQERSVEEVKKSLRKFGEDKVAKFAKWCVEFKEV